ncbi:unnamed protein product [Cladocopium goreaui]|uniref:Uncharacterized protein n=1 Tax=Cladocopium goreaui TaxID=2562237 RepID=A0A9P1GCG1_9DINO|nr:unnamed protein product [Cladocopium goreaui]
MRSLLRIVCIIDSFGKNQKDKLQACINKNYTQAEEVLTMKISAGYPESKLEIFTCNASEVPGSPEFDSLHYSHLPNGISACPAVTCEDACGLSDSSQHYKEVEVCVGLGAWQNKTIDTAEGWSRMGAAYHVGANVTCDSNSFFNAGSGNCSYAACPENSFRNTEDIASSAANPTKGPGGCPCKMVMQRKTTTPLPVMTTIETKCFKQHGKAVYWDLGSAQSLGSVTADLKPGVARVEVYITNNGPADTLSNTGFCGDITDSTTADCSGKSGGRFLVLKGVTAGSCVMGDCEIEWCQVKVDNVELAQDPMDGTGTVYAGEEPRSSFLLAARLSRRLIRTKRLTDCLGAISSAAELVRAVEDLASAPSVGPNVPASSNPEEQKVLWRCIPSAANTLQVECRRMLGVEVAALDDTTLRVSCLSRRHRPDTPELMAVIANLEPFVEWLQNAQGASGSLALHHGDAPGRTLRLPAGSIQNRLLPLWTYLRMYLTMLQLYLLQRHATSVATRCEMQPTAEAEWPHRWVRIQVPLPLGAMVGFEVVTEAESTEEARSKRRRLEATKALPQLRFFWRAEPSGDRMKDVLQRFESFFERYLAPKQRKEDGNLGEPNWEKLRASRLYPLLELLTAPRVWMLREAVRLLPPICRVAVPRKGGAEGPVRSSWQPLVEQFKLAPDDSSQAFAQRWQLVFVLASQKSQCPEPSLIRRMSHKDLVALARDSKAAFV